MNYVPRTVLIEHLIPRTKAADSSPDTHADAVLAYLRRNPSSSLKEVYTGLGYSKNSVSALLAKMVYKGALVATKSGGRWHGDTARNFYSVRVVQ